MEHVIFVDDEKVMLEIIKLKFKKEISENKIELHLFENGQECIDFIRQSSDLKINSLFSDITMPEMDGFSLANKINEEFSGIDIYMLSALDMDEYRMRAEKSQVKKLIGKPIDFSEVKSIIFDKS